MLGSPFMHTFEAGTFYRFEIVYNLSNIQVYLQVGDLRKKDLVLKTNDNDIQRGLVGLGTNNLKNVWFSAIAVEPKTKVGITEVRT